MGLTNWWQTTRIIIDRVVKLHTEHISGLYVPRARENKRIYYCYFRYNLEMLINKIDGTHAKHIFLITFIVVLSIKCHVQNVIVRKLSRYNMSAHGNQLCIADRMVWKSDVFCKFGKTRKTINK